MLSSNGWAKREWQMLAQRPNDALNARTSIILLDNGYIDIDLIDQWQLAELLDG